MEYVAYQWLVGFVLLPLIWMTVKYIMKQRDDAISELKKETKRQEEQIQTLKSRVVTLEASSVTKTELLEILRSIEESIEQRFDRSFDKLEKSFERYVGRRDN